MKLSTIIFLLLASLGLIACGGNNRPSQTDEDPAAAQRATEEQRWDEVMAVHDEVMPKMSEINRLSRALREVQEKDPAIPKELQATVETMVQELATAEEGMWEWMNNIKQLDALRQSKNHEEIMQYLGEEQEKIAQVRDNMLRSIEKGEQLLKQISPDHGEQ